MIELNGSATTSGDGIAFFAGAAGSTVRGLIINGFDTPGYSGMRIGALSVVAEGNYVGTNIAGTAAVPNDYGFAIDIAPQTASIRPSGLDRRRAQRHRRKQRRAGLCCGRPRHSDRGQLHRSRSGRDDCFGRRDGRSRHHRLQLEQFDHRERYRDCSDEHMATRRPRRTGDNDRRATTSAPM